MSSGTSDLTEGVALQAFLGLAKNSKGKTLLGAIQQILNAPNVFVFGELLELPQVQQLGETEDKKYLDLLKIFAYGTYSQYQANVANLPPLTPLQTKKLQQLSVVSLAAESKVIPYSVLQRELGISNLRELEDLIIDALYQGIIIGKLDQKLKQIEVEFTMGRDLKPDSLENMVGVLSEWNKQSQNLLETIKERISMADTVVTQDKKLKEEYEKRVETIKNNLKSMMESEMQSADFNDEMFSTEERRRGFRGSKKGQKDHMMAQKRMY